MREAKNEVDIRNKRFSSPAGGRVLERYNGWKLEWLHDSMLFLILAAVLLILFRHVIGLAVVGGDSMLPAFQDGNIVLYSRITGGYAPGDVVSMRVPSGEYYVKRIAAVGGDVVDLRDGIIYVNGKALDDPWATGETRAETGAVIYPYQVRPGNVFVLGDNREASMDSRAFGEVNLRQIKGKILFRIGPGARQSETEE